MDMESVYTKHKSNVTSLKYPITRIQLRYETRVEFLNLSKGITQLVSTLSYIQSDIKVIAFEKKACRTNIEELYSHNQIFEFFGVGSSDFWFILAYNHCITMSKAAVLRYIDARFDRKYHPRL